MKRILLLWTMLALCCYSLFAQPNVPTNLETTDIDDISAVISWNETNVENINYYEVNWWVSLSEEIFSMEITEETYQLLNLISGTQYLWKVRAIDIYGDTSAWSPTMSFYTLGFSTDCPEINNLVVGDMNNGQLLLQWDAEPTTTQWEVVMDEIGTNPFNTGFRDTTLNLEYGFPSLIPSHNYQFAVRSLCSSSVSNWKYIYARYLNENSVRHFPIQVSFEDSVSNSYVGLISSPSNPWIIGNADNEDASIDGHSIYVSNDNGTTVSFSNNNDAVSYAYIDFYVPENAVSFYIDFKYKSSINTDNAGMKVYMLSTGNPLSINNLPEENYRVGEVIYNNTQGEWVQEHIELPVEYAGSERRIAFAWFNNVDSLLNPEGMPCEIDNIYLTARYCAIPDSLRANYISATSAMLAWNIASNQSSYNLQYKKVSDEQWTEVNDIENNYLVYNLDPDTYYQFRVQADCISEESFWSEIDTFKTHVLANVPENLACEPTNVSAQISWNDDESTNYWLVSWKENQYNALWNTDTAMNNGKYLDNLSQNTEYLVKVAAINYIGDTSRWSDTLIFSTLCSPIQEFPYAINYIMDYNSVNGFINTPTCWQVNENTLNSVVFDLTQMTAPVLKFSYLANTNMSVRISTDGGETFAILEAGLLSNSFVDKKYSLLDYVYDTNVVVSFTCVDNHQQTSIMRIWDFTIEEGCQTPQIVNIDSISTDEISISWETGNGTLWNVYLEDEDSQVLSMGVTMNNSYTFSNLEPATLYNIVIYAHCGEELSLDSTKLDITTLTEQGNCQMPEEFEAYWWQTKGEETLYATWQQPNGANIWQVVYKDYYAYAWDTAQVTINPVFTLRNLELGSSYLVKVRTICAPGDTSEFTPIAVVTIGNSSIEEDASMEKVVEIFPNPTSGILNVTMENVDLSNAYLTDISGKVLIRWTELPEQIDISYLEKGVYLLNILEKTGGRIQKKIILQ
ncbi:MAG: fibronectin type III domain-containing protein [Bacteroidales bacterium]|nr:fibronectin type III domain-containing protein [Candidatus Scybalousia scybalohippi]